MHLLSVLLLSISTFSYSYADQFDERFRTLSAEIEPTQGRRYCTAVKLGDEGEKYIYTAEKTLDYFREMASFMQKSADHHRNVTLKEISQTCSEFQSSAEKSIQAQNTGLFQKIVADLPKQIAQRSELAEIISAKINTDIKKQILEELRQNVGKK